MGVTSNMSTRVMMLLSKSLRISCLNTRRYLSSIVPDEIDEVSLQSSYVIHPRIKIKLPEYQGYGLTGSREVEPPKRFLEFSENLDIAPWKRLIEKAVVFEKQFEARTVDSIHHNIPHLGFIQNAIKLLFSQSLSYPSLTGLHVYGECHVRSSWHCMSNRIDVRGRPGTLIKSNKPFQNFFNGSDLTSNIDNEEPNFNLDVDKLFTKLNTWNVHKDVPGTLLHSSVDSRVFPYYHTLIMFCKNESSYPAIIDKSLIYLHALATRQALNRNKKGELADPECVQGIITDGQEYSFIWYQLNSCFEDVTTGDIKNNAAVIKPQPLFNDIIQTTRRQDYSSWKLCYNDSILKHLISLFIWQANI